MSNVPQPRGMWQPITREEAATPRPPAPPTEQDNIRAALAYIRRHYVPRYTDYPEEGDDPQE